MNSDHLMTLYKERQSSLNNPNIMLVVVKKKAEKNVQNVSSLIDFKILKFVIENRNNSFSFIFIVKRAKGQGRIKVIDIRDNKLGIYSGVQLCTSSRWKCRFD